MNTLQLQHLMLTFAGWVDRSQRDVIDHLQEENRVFREQLTGRRLRLTDGQRRRLAAKDKATGRKGLSELGTLVTPDTLLRWYRRLIAKKYDGSRARKAGRPKTAAEIEQLIIRMARDNPRWGERFVRSIKSECLAQIIPLGERYLPRAVEEYTEPYHFERNHQGLNDQPIEKMSDEPKTDGVVGCRERLGGVLEYYDRRAG